jgi:hypothetical protein
LNEKQKALFLTYAETEKDVDGTINGIADTQSGNCMYLLYGIPKY